MMTKKTKTNLHNLAACLDIKSVDDSGHIEGYASVFGVKDSYGDIVAAGAFAASLAAHAKAGTLPAMLWQHDPANPAGVWEEMCEDARGLRVNGRLLMDIEVGRRAHALIKARAIRGLSIGYISKRWEWDEENDIRTLLEVDLWEVSIVTFPANREAEVDNVKSAIGDITSERDAEIILREAGFSRTDARALVARVKAVMAQREAARALADVKHGAERLLKLLKH